MAVTLYKRGAQTVALSRTQADLDSLKEKVRFYFDEGNDGGVTDDDDDSQAE